MAEKDNIEFAKQQIAALNARDLDGYLGRIDESYTGESETGPVSDTRSRRQCGRIWRIPFARFPI